MSRPAGAGGHRVGRLAAPGQRVELPAGVTDVGVPDPALRLGDDEQPAGSTGGKAHGGAGVVAGHVNGLQQPPLRGLQPGPGGRHRRAGARPLPGKHAPEHQVTLVTQPDEASGRVQPQQAVRVGPALERHEPDAEVGEAGAGQVGVRGGPGGDRGP